MQATACTITLIQQRSSVTCVPDGLNATFGCIGDTSSSARVWVAHGCRGRFLCNGVHTPCGYVHSGLQQRQTCTCGTAANTSAPAEHGRAGWVSGPSDRSRRVGHVASALAIKAWTVGAGRPPQSAREAAVLDRPCSGDLTTIGNNAHVQPALTLVSGDGVRRFSPMFSVFLHGHGFMLLENREPAEVALLQAVHASLSAAVLISSEKLHQPHRSKHLLPLDTLLTSSSSNATDDAARQAVSSLRGLQSLFFVAFHLLLPTPDYDAHGQLDSKTDYLQKVLEVATLYGVMDNLNRPGSTFQNPHWDYPNWDSGWLVIDVPLSDVRPGGGPIEIWPGTQHLRYDQTFVHSQQILRIREAEPRQYSKCFPEILSIAQLWPSALLHSSLGDMVVRNPSTWHRGTPNSLASPRHMLSFIFRRRRQHAVKKPV